MYHSTQIEAYQSLRPALSHRRKLVYEVISKYNIGLGLFEIQQKLGWPINCVSGRVTELRKLGLIEDRGQTVINPVTGKRAIAWFAV